MNEVELCLMVVSIFLTLPCNIANIAIILRADRLHIGPSYVLFNLYIADMLVVSLNMIKFITKGWNQIDAVSKVISNISLLSVIGLAIDRHIAVKYPYQYHRIMTKRFLLHCLVLAWIGSIIFVFSRYFSQTHRLDI